METDELMNESMNESMNENLNEWTHLRIYIYKYAKELVKVHERIISSGSQQISLKR